MPYPLRRMPKNNIVNQACTTYGPRPNVSLGSFLFGPQGPKFHPLSLFAWKNTLWMETNISILALGYAPNFFGQHEIWVVHPCGKSMHTIVQNMLVKLTAIFSRANLKVKGKGGGVQLFFLSKRVVIFLFYSFVLAYNYWYSYPSLSLEDHSKVKAS